MRAMKLIKLSRSGLVQQLFRRTHRKPDLGGDRLNRIDPFSSDDVSTDSAIILATFAPIGSP